MAQLVANCPRCKAHDITFDVNSALYTHDQFGWQRVFEAFSVCRHCNTSTVFVLSDKKTDNSQKQFSTGKAIAAFDKALNPWFEVEGFINQKYNIKTLPPEHTPQNIKNAYVEGATCLAAECYNASAAMFRLCVDLSTKPLLPDPSDTTKPQPKFRQRRDLGMRLPWLFEHKFLPPELERLASCIREDGNDGAHDGSLTKADAEDLVDFTRELLTRIFTEPARLAEAEKRRLERRKSNNV